MEEWKECKLGEYLYIKGRIGWKGLKKDEYLNKSPYRIINGESLTEKGIEWSKAGFITKERYDESPEIMLEINDILLSKDGTIGKIGFVKELLSPTTVASGIFVIRNIKPEIIDTMFIYHFLRSSKFKNFIKMRTEGSVIPHLYQKDFEELNFPLPPLHTQQKIADILSSLDDKIELNNKINTNLEQQAQALFKKTFADKIDNVSDKDGKTLGSLIDIVDNRGKTPPSSNEKNDFPILDVGALNSTGRIINYKNCTKYVDEQTYSTFFRDGHPQENDILISTVGSLAQMKFFKGNKGCIAQNVVAFRTLNTSPFYLYEYLKFIKNDLLAYDIGSVQPSIKVTHIIKHLIYIPTNDELANFDSFAKSITEQIYNNVCENERLISIRNTLLPKLMSGEIEVNKKEL